MKLISYTLGFPPTEMRPGPAQRPWMDSTSDRFAYRCLPLNIANQYGWELLCPCSFEVTWDGGPSPDAMVVEILEDGWPHPTSHFGHGVLTFHVNQIFRTEPGTQLMTTGPMNNPKDGIAALSGIIETDWSHYTFTMNWVMTRAFHTVRFQKGAISKVWGRMQSRRRRPVIGPSWMFSRGRALKQKRNRATRQKNIDGT